MKYLLVVFGNFRKKTNLVKTIAESISIVTDEESVKYSYGDNVAIMNFNSLDDQEEVAIYVDELLKGVATLFFLTPYTDNVYTSLPMDVHKYLFGESEIIDEDNYSLEDEIDIDRLIPPLNSKSQTKVVKPKIKELSLDEILDKINTEGIYSLTEQERQTLETHSNRI
jgi:hypothetical protein